MDKGLEISFLEGRNTEFGRQRSGVGGSCRESREQWDGWNESKCISCPSSQTRFSGDPSPHHHPPPPTQILAAQPAEAAYLESQVVEVLNCLSLPPGILCIRKGQLF